MTVDEVEIIRIFVNFGDLQLRQNQVKSWIIGSLWNVLFVYANLQMLTCKCTKLNY